MFHADSTFRRLACTMLVGLALAPFGPLACQSTGSASVLILVNDASPVSLAIGEAYARSRGISRSRVLALTIPVEDPLLGDAEHETITSAQFDSWIRQPVERHLEAKGWKDEIEIIVTTKGIPLRVDGSDILAGTWMRDVTRASVDAELSLLFSDRIGSPGVANDANPYFGSELSFHDFRAQHPDAPLRYLVARLTGYGDTRGARDSVPDDVASLIERAQQEREPNAPEASWLVDLDPSLTGGLAAGNIMLLAPTAASLEAIGVPVDFDETDRFVGGREAIQGYASWGSNDDNDREEPFYGEIGGEKVPGSFAPRAIAVELVSTDARSFSAAPKYGQSLVADLVHLGVAGATGHVWEPALSGVPRPYILLADYARGVRAIEAYYRSIPYLGWMNVYIGDPLMTIEEPVDGRVPDRDGDGTADRVDNCIRIPNPRQRDTNGDGFGNRCDPDVDGDGLVTTSWGSLYPLTRRGDVEWIALTHQNGPHDPNHDLDGDGDVDETDVSIAALSLFHPPGPSAQARSGAR